MSRTVNRLTAKAVATAKTSGLHANGGGLYLNVKTTGFRSWLFIYSWNGRRQRRGWVRFLRYRCKTRERSAIRRERISRSPGSTRGTGVRHRPAMPYAQVPDFVLGLKTRISTSARALEFLILTWTRTSEVLKLSWSEVDFDAALWIDGNRAALAEVKIPPQPFPAGTRGPTGATDFAKRHGFKSNDRAPGSPRPTASN